jgi:SAM-dependent methyltransferase
MPETIFVTAPRDDKSQSEFERWNSALAGDEFFYGHEPGPIAVRTVRYAQSAHRGGNAIDLGCGEGQDLAFLARSGYDCTGVEWTPNGVAKTKQLLQSLNFNARVLATDLRDWKPTQQYHLLLAVNSIQFTGESASGILNVALEAVAPNGFIGLSFWARESGQSEIENGVWLPTKSELLARMNNWQMCEVADLWQWSGEASRQFVTIVARKNG